MIDLYLQAGIALILVSGLIVLLGLFTKKRQDKANLMNIMGYQSLGPKKGLAMVRVGHEVILVGVTATDVKLLKSIDQFSDDAPRCASFEKTLATATAAANLTAREATTAGEIPAAPPAAPKTAPIITADASPASDAGVPASDVLQSAVKSVAQATAKTSRVIVADVSANLSKLRALKDYLYAVK